MWPIQKIKATRVLKNYFMKNRYMLLLGLGFLLLFSSQKAAEQPHLRTSNLLSNEDTRLIDSLFSDFSGDRPGATVMIAKGDQLLFCKSYGQIDLGAKKQATNDTRYHLASASKQFTAMAILQLIESGKISLSTSLKEIFPAFPAYGKPITIQHLLTHQSGLAEINPPKEEERSDLMTDHYRLEQLMLLDSLQFTPGTACEYNNTGYSVLAEIVRKISGLEFGIYMEQEIFSKIGMTSTTYYPEAESTNIGYHILSDTITRAPGVRDATKGSGSVYTSAHDYFRWHLALCNDKLLAPELLSQAFTPQAGTKNRWGTYGYGWYTMEHDGYPYVEHGGITQSAGFISFTARIPQEQVTVAIFTNRAWTKANIPSQNIGKRAKVLLGIASEGKFSMPSLADIDPQPKHSLAQALIDEVLANGIDAGIILLTELKHSDKYYLSENEMNQVGYALINSNRIEAAIKVLETNVQLFPDSWNVYDSLAEAYMINGDKALSLKLYQQSLALNPQNENATKQIYKLSNK